MGMIFKYCTPVNQVGFVGDRNSPTEPAVINKAAVEQQMGGEQSYMMGPIAPKPTSCTWKKLDKMRIRASS